MAKKIQRPLILFGTLFIFQIARVGLFLFLNFPTFQSGKSVSICQSSTALSSTSKLSLIEEIVTLLQKVLPTHICSHKVFLISAKLKIRYLVPLVISEEQDAVLCKEYTALHCCYNSETEGLNLDNIPLQFFYLLDFLYQVVISFDNKRNDNVDISTLCLIIRPITEAFILQRFIHGG